MTEVEMNEGVCGSTEEAPILAWGGFRGQVGFDRKFGIRGASRDRGETIGAEKNIVGMGEPSVSFEWL